ncbi:MAG TPA: ferredoxin [Acidimicrobiales bacterium]|nr:ferredoxin [Acidimicrobiales bacterium]
MRVVIDAELCQGHGRCFIQAPHVFGFDELGNGVVLGTGELTEATRPGAELAVANCPEHAISIVEG